MMSFRNTALTVSAALLSVVGVASPALSNAGTLNADVRAALSSAAPSDTIDVIVSFSGTPTTTRCGARDDGCRSTLLRTLRTRADRDQAMTRQFTAVKGATRMTTLWLRNELAVSLSAADVAQLANQPGVSTVRLDAVVPLATTVPAGVAVTEWNLNALRIPDVWGLGYDGANVVVGSLDTGVDGEHPDLINNWRGGSNSWYDPHNQHATPYDADGHGTQTMGLAVGGNTSGTAIGVAPGAKWIAAKIYDDAGQAQYSDIHLSFQWMIDPDGNAATADQPHIVNASWGLSGSQGTCVGEFAGDILQLKNAGIAVVFAAGNDGPNPNTSVSPANNPGSYSVGAVDQTMTVANFSSRGPSACDGSIYPSVTAPGVSVTTTDLSFGGLPLYAVVTGTSFAAPHVAGAMALLRNAYPAADVTTLEAALAQSAQDKGTAGADNDYGAGVIDALAAYNALNTTPPPPPPPTDLAPIAQPDDFSTERNHRLSVKAPGVLANDRDPENAPLTAQLVSSPANGKLKFNSDGSFIYAPRRGFVGTDSFTYRVNDGTLDSEAALVTINVKAHR